jgi:hypothetical protein
VKFRRTENNSRGIDGTVRLWQLRDHPTGEIVGRHDGPVYSVAFSPDGTRLVSGGRDTTARLWDVEEREEINRFRGHSDRIFTISFTADGRGIVTGGWDKSARLWEADVANSSRRKSSTARAPVRSCFLRMAGGSFGTAVSGALGYDEHLGDPWGLVGLLPDGRQSVTQDPARLPSLGVDDGSPGTFTRHNADERLGHQASFSPDGKKVALISEGTNAVVWARNPGRDWRCWRGRGDHHFTELLARWKWLATAYDNGRARLYAKT